MSLHRADFNERGAGPDAGGPSDRPSRVDLGALTLLREEHDPVLGFTWEVLEPAEGLLSELGRELGTLDGRYRIGEGTAFATTPLPWLAGHVLMRFRHRAWEPRRLALYFVLDPRQTVYRLNGTAAPVHAMNTGGTFTLQADAVACYLRFFCFFVRGEAGPFLVVEPGDRHTLGAHFRAETLELLGEHAGELRCRKIGDAGRPSCDATVFHGTHLYRTRFAVHLDGRIEMVDDRPLLSMPEAPDFPI